MPCDVNFILNLVLGVTVFLNMYLMNIEIDSMKILHTPLSLIAWWAVVD